MSLVTISKIDSLARPDSLNEVQAEIASVVEHIANTPADKLMGELLDKAIIFGLKVLAAFIIYFIGAWIIRKFKGMLTRFFVKKDTDAAIASFVQSLVSIALTIVLILVTIGTLGVDTSSLAALLTGGGLAVGMALNGTVQNFAGGIMLLVFRPFKAGDYIASQGFEGTVSEINIVSTKLTTVDNRCIIIPNGILSNEIINNFSQNPLRRVDWTINVEYGASVEDTKELLMSLMYDDKRIIQDEKAPALPFVALKSLDDNGISFVMRAWVKAEDYWSVCYDMNERIYKELPDKGIQFPYPKLDVIINNK
ncbi:MAG: mechanosensitive ion channel [Bacteroidales bacterium]|nr:mechanosensitive ion channel [Bacteroidales bacterium]